MAKWELTNKLSAYLDRHLVIPLLEFHAVNGMYDDTHLSKAKLELLADTSMVDFYIEAYLQHELYNFCAWVVCLMDF